MTSIKLLLEEAKKVNQQFLLERQNKYGFNMFEVEEIDRKEVQMCRFLRAILDPKSGHRKGNSFLLSFAKDVLELSLPQEGVYTVEKEVLIDENRRIDIVIQGEGFWIPIEAKIEAGDQPMQCYDYLQYAKKKVENPRLFYLTPKRRPPSAQSSNGEERNIHPIGWGQVKQWLSSCIKELNTESDLELKFCLRQFCDAIENFIFYAEMEVKMKEKMRASVDTLQAAATIYQNYNSVKTQILKDFFDILEVRLAQSVEKMNGSEELLKKIFYKDLQDNIERYYKFDKSSNPSITYVLTKSKYGERLSNVCGNDYGFAIRIEIGWTLYIGLCFPSFENEEWIYRSKLPARWRDVEIRSQDGLKLLNEKQDGWWLAWSYIGFSNGEKLDFKSDDAVKNDSYFKLAERKNIEYLAEICQNKFEKIFNYVKDNILTVK